MHVPGRAITHRSRLVPVLLLALALAVNTAAEPSLPSGEVVKLTDDNFDELTADTSVPWFVAVTAPWCTHCQELKPTWRNLAAQLKGQIHVGEVDSTTDPVLQSRFHVEGYPSLYYLRDGETRSYMSARTLQHMEHFLDGGWKAVKPVAALKSPISQQGRILGQLRMVPYNVRAYYKYLHNEKKYSVLTLLAAFLSVPVLFGLLSICALDAFFTRAARQGHRPLAPTHHPHAH
eukprot:CAMPEP_0206148568 /NCGR_PEP_ID=MMETSP1473-20131121/37011_1 /ASSEMBLY_ACC=CAM_ASM_001109 /TAXON_ID=1461547 /ORGANISM="Stichococcus sp, Strain RCC1054" /LENGTH=232 /DNA_ID=CAMNT_0053545947 /DNA_START=193 /DNA_END=891 /DNA_ORIENTATION=-